MLMKFSEKAQKAIVVAESIAFDLGHQNVGSEHLLLSLLKPLERQFEILGEYAGLHVLIRARGPWPEHELTAAAEEAGLRVYGLSGFYMKREECTGRGTILLGYGGLQENEIRTGAGLLVQALLKTAGE